jgi:hypothetical protein
MGVKGESSDSGTLIEVIVKNKVKESSVGVYVVRAAESRVEGRRETVW